MTIVHGRLAGVSVRASFAAGAWVGFALGIVAGAVIGALLSWFAGAILGWQRELALTLGVTRALLPFGDQIPILRWVSTTWWLVIPLSAVLVGIFVALVGGLIGALLAISYNRSPRHAGVVVELEHAAEVQAVAEAAGADDAEAAVEMPHTEREHGREPPAPPEAHRPT